jgi:hypothetical protein
MGEGKKVFGLDELEAHLEMFENMTKDPADFLQYENADQTGLTQTLDTVFEMIEARLRNEHPTKYEEYRKLPSKDKLAYAMSVYPELSTLSDRVKLEKIDKIVYQLLARILDSSYVREISIENAPSISSLVQNLCLSGTIVFKFAYDTKDSNRERTILFLHHYKTAVEGLFKWQIDLVAYALVRDARRYYRGNKLKKLKSYGQVKKENLGYKLNFLKKQGFGLLSDSCNATLRNCVAHESYEVFEDGSIRYWDKRQTESKMTQSELSDTIQELYSTCFAFNQSLFNSFSRIAQERLLSAIEKAMTVPTNGEK